MMLQYLSQRISELYEANNILAQSWRRAQSKQFTSVDNMTQITHINKFQFQLMRFLVCSLT